MARLLAWIYDEREPFTLAIDHVEAVTNPEALDIVTQIGAAAPRAAPSARGLPCRTPLARAQAAHAHGRLYELGFSDLALDPKEAADLLRRSGVELLPTDVEELTTRTEGWAAGLYLAALAMQKGPDSHRPPAPARQPSVPRRLLPLRGARPPAA